VLVKLIDATHRLKAAYIILSSSHVVKQFSTIVVQETENQQNNEKQLKNFLY